MPKNPKDCTHKELLLELVPDFDERFQRARTDKPELFEAIRKQAVETADGFRPLHYLQGCM